MVHIHLNKILSYKLDLSYHFNILAFSLNILNSEQLEIMNYLLGYWQLAEIYRFIYLFILSIVFY